MPASTTKSELSMPEANPNARNIDDKTLKAKSLKSEDSHKQDTEHKQSLTSSEASDLGFAIQEEEKVKIINRLRRLEGQVRGLQRMVEEERSCRDVLTLLAGVRSALNATADRILVNYLEHCQTEFLSHDAETQELDIQELVQAVKLARG